MLAYEASDELQHLTLARRELFSLDVPWLGIEPMNSLDFLGWLAHDMASEFSRRFLSLCSLSSCSASRRVLISTGDENLVS